MSEIVTTARRYVTLSLPLCASLEVAARWAPHDALTPWASALRALCNEAEKVQNGHTALLGLRWVPALFATFAAALSAISAERFQNLRTLVVDPEIATRYGEGNISLIEVVDPWKPFREVNDIVPNVLARHVIDGDDPVAAYEALAGNKAGKRYAPASDWLHAELQRLGDDWFLDDSSYDVAFKRTELFLGLLTQDLAAQRITDPERAWLVRSNWFGRSTWQDRYSRKSSVEQAFDEYSREGSSWPPLAAGLFGKDSQRVEDAFAGYSEDYNRIRQHRF